MKISLFTLTVVLLNVTLLQAQTLSRLIAESTYFGNYFNPDTVAYTYTGNNGGDLTHTLRYTTLTDYTIDTPLKNNYLQQQTFDGSNNILTTLKQVWNGTGWQNLTKYLYAYDANNNDTSQILQNWDSTRLTWVNYSHANYTYVNGNHTYQLLQVYDSALANWINAEAFSWTYAGNNLTNYLIQNWSAYHSSFINRYQTFYNYNYNNDDTLDVSSVYDTLTNAWYKKQLQYFTYDAMHHVLMEGAVDSFPEYARWDSTGKEYNYYDAAGNDTCTISYGGGISLAGDTLILDGKIVYTYNNYNQETSDTRYDHVNSAYMFNEKTNYYYQNYTYNAVKQVVANDNILLYPNPATSLVHLTVKLPQEEPVQLGLYNLTGSQLWFTDFGNAVSVNASIPVNNLSAGFYLLEVKTGDKVEWSKVVVGR